MEIHFLVPGLGPRASLQRTHWRLRSLAKAVLRRGITSSYQPSRLDLQRSIDSFGIPIQTHNIDIGSRALEREAKRLKLDVLLPSFYALPFGSELPWLGYLYDFQHRHMPDFFSVKEREQRDFHFASMLKHAPAVIVNSKSVEADIERFYPDARTQVFALPFSTAPTKSWLSISEDVAREAYLIPPRYFIICNQFWIHKDHATAFAAFAEIAKIPEYADVDLVCTGSTSDHRSVGHLDRLLAQLDEMNIRSRVHILGLIPKNDQIGLMKGAAALLQPTLSEGGPGGGAVYDAIAIGTPSIVSNIPVNLEIANEDLISFFPAGDASMLAMAMKSILANHKIDLASDVLLNKGMARRIHCGKILLSAIDHVMSKRAVNN